MRKKKREMSAKFAYGVLDRAPYVTVSFTLPDGSPYGLPLSIARVDGNYYFHCALKGEKLDAISNNPHVCLSAVSRCHPVMDPLTGSFTTEYESAVAFGKAEMVESREEKVLALRAICQRYLPQHMDHFEAALSRSLSAAVVVRISLTAPPTGKRKLYGSDGKEVPGDMVGAVEG